MKKLFYLLAAISLTAGADAKTITLSQAEDIAAGFIKGKAVNAPRLKKVPGNTTDKNVSLPYYIYNYDGGGFIIVSGDDRFGEILAYSHSGAIDPVSAPGRTHRFARHVHHCIQGSPF